ncbi:MAG TPA: class I SAM-dependent methyltransferase [Solirubrobacteraceae bacterium]|nr:class I SAM-dependent methyltransferase [Solirubrobacteraceae bacterium]
MSRRDIEGRALRVLGRFNYPLDRLPPRLQPLPMLNIREISLRRPDALVGVERIVPGAGSYVDGFSAFWEEEIVPAAIYAHRNFHGEYAGAGPVDFIEAFTLYALIREHQPQRVLESGFACGISSLVIARGLLDNGAGELDTVDIKDNGDIVSEFYRLAGKGVIHPTFGDARAFARETAHDYQLTFSDALHKYAFNRELAAILRERFPAAIHCYHEWSLAPGVPTADTRYVSMRANLGRCGERRAFEEAFPHSRHIGVPSSSGLGVVLPR